MDIAKAENVVRDDILEGGRRLFGFTVLEAEPIKRGWLNLKWKIATDAGVFFIKQYNRERFKLYDSEDLMLAFSQQMRLHEAGFPCPLILSKGDQFLFESDHGELFIVMAFCEGSLSAAGQLNELQMYDLGRVTGFMHRLLNDGTLGVREKPEFVPPGREERMAYWKSLLAKADGSELSHLCPIMEQQLKVSETMNLEDFLFREPGWVHRDLWVDNLLFKENRVSAVLDFDRMKYDWPALDVARAVISGALDRKQLDLDLAQAFMEGYREHRLVVGGFLTNALKFLWLMESTWWIHLKMDRHSAPPARFAEEMIWLSENFHSLASILGRL